VVVATDIGDALIAILTEIFMPCLQQQQSMLRHQHQYAIDLASAKAGVLRKCHGGEPCLERCAAPIDMEMGRLVRFVAVK